MICSYSIIELSESLVCVLGCNLSSYHGVLTGSAFVTDLPVKVFQASVFKSSHLHCFDFTFKPNNLVGLVVMSSSTLK